MKNIPKAIEMAKEKKISSQTELSIKGDNESLWGGGILEREDRSSAGEYVDRPLWVGSTMGSLYENPQIISAGDYKTFCDCMSEIDNLFKDDGSALFNYGWIYRYTKYIQGDILTILDASLEDSPKSKAIKDLVRKSLQDRIMDLADSAYFASAENINRAVLNSASKHVEYVNFLDKQEF